MIVSMLIAAVVVITTAVHGVGRCVLALGWWVFGQHRRRYARPAGARCTPYGRWPAGRPAAHGRGPGSEIR